MTVPFQITGSASDGNLRLESSAKLTAKDDFARISDALSMRGVEAFRAIKSAPVAAREALEDETIKTHINGEETTNTAKTGDWIVTNMDTSGKIIIDDQGHKNVYVVKPDKFANIYERSGVSTEDGIVCHPIGEQPIDVLYFAGGFNIVAPWDERQQAASGYIVRKGGDVYGIHARAFEQTYERL